MILIWLLIWLIDNMPRVEWFGPVWNNWGISLLISIILL